MTRSRFEEEQERKKERLTERAARAAREGQAAHDAVDRIARAIPFGQPILVGHHSEGRHRADIKRIDRGMRKAFEKSKEADELRRRAEAVGTAGISSDDPAAVQKLTAKLEDLERRQEWRKKVNAAWRKAGQPEPKTSAGWEPVAAALEVSVTAMNEIRLEMAMVRTYQPGAPPFPSYALTNASAEMRRLKQRIAELERAVGAAHIEKDHSICRVIEDPADNRIRLIFPGKPEEKVRALLKSWGFRWSPMAAAWQRHLNNAGRVAAQCVVDALQKEAPHGNP